MVEIHISRKARKDLDIIKSYIAKDNPTRAESFAHELLTHCIETVSSFPLSCPIYNKPNTKVHNAGLIVLLGKRD